jgi:hypothetical protein
MSVADSKSYDLLLDLLADLLIEDLAAEEGGASARGAYYQNLPEVQQMVRFQSPSEVSA